MRYLQRRTADVDHGGKRGAQLGVADLGQRLGDGRVWRQNDRVGRHHAAGGPLLILQQPADVLRLVLVHQLQQLLGGLGRQLGDQVGGVVGRHLLQHVGCPFAAELVEDLHLVVLRQLLQDVRQPLVVESRGNLAAPLGRQIVDDAREVGGTHRVERRQQVGMAPWPTSLPVSTLISFQCRTCVCPRRPNRVEPSCRATRASCQSWVRSCSIAMS